MFAKPQKVRLEVHSPNESTAQLGLYNTAAGKLWQQSVYNDGAWRFIESFVASDRLVLAAGTGNVGIGTSVPQARLQVHSADENTAQFGLYNTAAGKLWQQSVYNDGSWRFVEGGVSSERLVILPGSGNVGFGVGFPAYPLQMASGARCTVGGVWTNASSREYKQDIRDLSTEAAEEAFAKLTPVTFAYKAAPEEHHVGFIAEDAPDLVATADRKGMSALDVVAVLTKVVQEQQKTIAELSAKVAELKQMK